MSLETISDDRALIEGTLNGDGDAYGRLVQKHRHFVLNLALRVVKNHQEAEDVVQQVFIDAYRHLAAFRKESQLSTWLYSITMNRARNHLRDRKAGRFLSMDSAPSQDSEVKSITFADPSPSTEKLLEEQSEIDWLKQEIKNLPEEFRTIFMLHYFENLQLMDIAQRIGRPLGTVKVYLHRARKELLRARTIREKRHGAK